MRLTSKAFEQLAPLSESAQRPWVDVSRETPSGSRPLPAILGHTCRSGCAAVIRRQHWCRAHTTRHSLHDATSSCRMFHVKRVQPRSSDVSRRQSQLQRVAHPSAHRHVGHFTESNARDSHITFATTGPHDAGPRKGRLTLSVDRCLSTIDFGTTSVQPAPTGGITEDSGCCLCNPCVELAEHHRSGTADVPRETCGRGRPRERTRPTPRSRLHPL